MTALFVCLFDDIVQIFVSKSITFICNWKIKSLLILILISLVAYIATLSVTAFGKTCFIIAYFISNILNL